MNKMRRSYGGKGMKKRMKLLRMKSAIMRKCCVCKENEKTAPERRFFEFPEDLERSKRWTDVLGIPKLNRHYSKTLHIWFKVCSIHFEDKDFTSREKEHLLPTAVPKDFPQFQNMDGLKIKSLQGSETPLLKSKQETPSQISQLVELSSPNATKQDIEECIKAFELQKNGSSEIIESQQFDESTECLDNITNPFDTSESSEEATSKNCGRKLRKRTLARKKASKTQGKKLRKRTLDSSIPSMNEAIKRLKEISEENKNNANEFNVFCESLAIQLNKMPLHRAIICQEKLQSVMTTERIFQLTQTSSQSNIQ